jgi:hypothetical protein
MRRADRDFRHDPEACEDFLIFLHPSSLALYLAVAAFISDSAANDDMRDAIIARLAKAAWDSAQSSRE